MVKIPTHDTRTDAIYDGSWSRSRVAVRMILIEGFVVLALGVALAMLGPFGTFTIAGIGERMVYWCALALLAYALYRPASLLADQLSAGLDLPRLAMWSLTALIATLPMTLLVWLASFRHTPSLWPDAGSYFEMYGQVLLVGAVIMAAFWLTRARMPSLSSPVAPESSEQLANNTGNTLRGRVGEPILALEMEDHYVRVHTAASSHLLLMRMRDAVAQMDRASGLQIHRSWWVARDAVTDVCGDGRNLSLILANGLAAPVSRNSVAALRDAGWLTSQDHPAP